MTKLRVAVGWRNELTRQDIADIYELTYKYQMLKQEAALGDYGVPTILPDAAYIEFEKIKGELSQKLENAWHRLTEVFESWVEHHQEGAEVDLSEIGYREIEEDVHDATDYSDLLSVFSEEEVQQVLAGVVKKYFDWTDPESMTYAELIAFLAAQDVDLTHSLFDDLKSALMSSSIVDEIVMERMESIREDVYQSTELASVMEMRDELNDEWEELPEGLDKDIEIFQKALTTAHNNGSMAEYILEVDGKADRDAIDFLSDLSENPEHSEKWDAELSRLLGYPVRTRTVPKSDWFVSSRLRRVIQALRRLAMKLRIEADSFNPHKIRRVLPEKLPQVDIPQFEEIWPKRVKYHPAVHEGDFIMVEGDQGTEWVDVEYVDPEDVQRIKEQIEMTGEANLEGTSLYDFCENNRAYDIDVVHGFAALAFPGDLTVFNTREEAEDHFFQNQ
jgi:hypothetical protein